jgi:hypothetical protein
MIRRNKGEFEIQKRGEVVELREFTSVDLEHLILDVPAHFVTRTTHERRCRRQEMDECGHKIAGMSSCKFLLRLELV